MKRFWIMLCVGLMLGATAGGSLAVAIHRAQIRMAQHCVDVSNGTDTEVERCYTDRRLKLPEGYQ